MPFANLQMPSIALTQLKSVVEDKFANEVTVDVYYFNHDFANLGLELYEQITRSAESQNSGLGAKGLLFQEEDRYLSLVLNEAKLTAHN